MSICAIVCAHALVTLQWLSLENFRTLAARYPQWIMAAWVPNAGLPMPSQVIKLMSWLTSGCSSCDILTTFSALINSFIEFRCFNSVCPVLLLPLCLSLSFASSSSNFLWCYTHRVYGYTWAFLIFLLPVNYVLHLTLTIQETKGAWNCCMCTLAISTEIRLQK